MAVTSSGEIKLIGDVNNEINDNITDTDVSLTTLSTEAGKSAPHGLQEFYGYSAVAAPTVTCQAASSVTGTSMTLNGNVTATGGENVSHGFYIGTNASYASNTKVTVATGQGTGAYTYNATSLTAATTYYINAWASNSGGETVSSQVTQMTSFTATYRLTSSNSYVECQHMTSPFKRTQYYDPATTSYSNIDYYESTSPIWGGANKTYFNNVSPYSGINGCRGERYSGYTGSENWYNIWDDTSSTCYPQLHEAANTSSRYITGSTLNYHYGWPFSGTDYYEMHLYKGTSSGFDTSGQPSNINPIVSVGTAAVTSYSSMWIGARHTASGSPSSYSFSMDAVY